MCPLPLARATRRMTEASSCPTRLSSRPWGSARDPEPEPVGAVRSPGGALSREDRAPTGHGDQGEGKSSKGRIALKETAGRAHRHDRGSGFFEFLTHAKELRVQYLIRAHTDSAGRMAGRLLVPEDRAGCAPVLETLSNAPALGALAVEVPGNGRRPARSGEGAGIAGAR